MDIRDRRTQVIGAVVVIVIIVLLAVFLTGSPGGEPPTPTATPGPTATGGPTGTPEPTATYKPTAIPTGEGYAVYFTQPSYEVSGEGVDFYTTINITPIEIFFAAEFGLDWDCTLFELVPGWTQSSGGGQLYNGTSTNPGWTKATSVGVNLAGENPQCTDSTQGHANFLVDWGNYIGLTRDGLGVDVTREGTIVTLRWRTLSGADYKTGTADISWGVSGAGQRKLVGFDAGSYEYTKPITWMNTSVTVE
jgi:hypothetical protein